MDKRIALLLGVAIFTEPIYANVFLIYDMIFGDGKSVYSPYSCSPVFRPFCGEYVDTTERMWFANYCLMLQENVRQDSIDYTRIERFRFNDRDACNDVDHCAQVPYCGNRTNSEIWCFYDGDNFMEMEHCESEKKMCESNTTLYIVAGTECDHKFDFVQSF